MERKRDKNNGSLTETSIAGARSTRWLGHNLHYFAAVDSTNEVLAQLAAQGAAHGTLVISDFQRRGRGRLQRRWMAPRGSSLLLSLLFRPYWPARQATWLTMAGGLAAVRAIEDVTSLRAGLKWPNDVMLATTEGWAKTGGLLLETQLTGEKMEYAILGIGLNVNIPAADLPTAPTPPTSLLVAGGQLVPRLPLLASLLLHLEVLYEQAARGTSPQGAWNERLITLGHPVTVGAGSRTVSGVAVATDEWGRLLVRDDEGQTHTVAAGDVTLRGTSLPNVGGNELTER